MIYFHSTIAALQAHIVELQVRLAASESERQALLDRLLSKHRIEPVTDAPKGEPSNAPLQYIAPPGVNYPEIQDAMRDVWMQEEVAYLMNTLGYDEDRAYHQANAEYDRKHGLTH